MTRQQLIDALAKDTGITKNKAELAIRLVLDSITHALAAGERVEIRGFGSLGVKEYGPRTGRNPKTGTTVKVAATRRPFFRAGKELKARMNPDLNT